MSYEGYERVLCHKGHLHEAGCYDHEFHDGWVCPDCGGPRVWWEGVDQTNDAGDKTTLVVHVAAHTCTCAECGDVHKRAPVQYCIPGKPDPNDPSVMIPTKPLLNVLPQVPLVQCGYTLIETGEEFATAEELCHRHNELWEQKDREHDERVKRIG